MFPRLNPFCADVFANEGVTRTGEMLLLAVAVYLLLVAVGRLLKRRVGTRLGVVYQMFCAVAGPLVAVTLLQPTLPGRRELSAAAVLLGTGVLIRLVDQYFWGLYFQQRRKAAVPKFIREVAAGLLLVAVALLVLEYGYGVQVPGLLAASGVIGIILGFAMQDSLGNIIAGFALQFGRPFQVGDWLLVDGQHVQAVEINWRSTRFVNNDDVQLDVPNQSLVRQTITNFHGGGALHAMRLEVGVDYEVPPNRVKDLLKRAAAAASGVRADPEPVVFLKNFGESAIGYEVRFWVDDHRLYGAVTDAVRTSIWYTLHRNHVRIPNAIRTLHLERTTSRGEQASKQQAQSRAVIELLREQPIFATLGEVQLQMLAAMCPAQHYGRGEAIIHEGARGESMFVLIEGDAGVMVTPDDHPTWVATLRRGDCFGEMSLLSGERRSASVLASSDCEVMEITKPVFAEIVAQDAGLLPRLSELLARRQLETEGIVAAHAQRTANLEATVQAYQATFLTRLKSFFEL